TRTRTRTRTRLTSLTGVRFFAAFAVFLFHIAIGRPFADKALSDGAFTVFCKAGWVGVSFFFVLSGFILTWSARPQDSTTAFWRRRLVKVFPNHLVTHTATMALYAGATVAGGTAVLNLLLLQPWVPDEDVYFSVDNPSWSLGCELFFYLLFPLLHRAVARVRAHRLWGCALSLMAAVIALPAVVSALVPAEPSMLAPDKPLPASAFWLVYVFPVTRVLDFVLGIVMARIVLEGRWRRFRPLPLTALFVACYAASLYLPAVYALNAATIVPVALLIPAVAHLDTAGRHTWLRARSLQWLGEVSFAFYLVHWPVLVYGRRLLGETRQYSWPAGIGLTAACAALSLLIAALLYTGVERPAMRRWASARPRPRPLTAVPTDELPAPPAAAGPTH
ncbi:acyltransferase family protein, partial [Streptomyces sp. SID486]|uniref:acyltransferase family protein n=1 Tax=Streptomyces sp. SID486 TaxID=2690264 RepID=UPI0013687EA7|nr:acyltransferase family protein [Streptomyces sp. SID486]